MKLRTNLFITFSLLLFVTAGCGKNGLDRAVVYGTVTYDGKEVGDGDITFFPKPGTKGSGGGGRIIRGKYRFSEGGGVPLGEYKVIIDAYELAPGADPPPPVIGLDDSRGKRYLPAKYNKETTLELKVESSDELEHNFVLEK